MQIENGMDMYKTGVELLYSVESQILEALPKMIDAAQHDEVKHAFRLHLEQTRGQRDRLEPILQGLGAKPGGAKPGGAKDEALAAIVHQAETEKSSIRNKMLIDPLLIAAAQKVEHYEIAAYGTATTFAKMLGREQDQQALFQTLQEEKETDEKLTEIAKNIVNPEALKAA
jgi:ferritin-like metal-binding protein YciE